MIREEKLQEVFKAKQQIVEGSLTIWNARLETLAQAGDLKGLLDQMKSPVEPVADQGNCGNCVCGAEMGKEFVQPVTKK